MCIHDVSYLHKREIDKLRWIHNMKEGEFLESANKHKIIKSQFGINHPALFFSVWDFKLDFPYLNFPKIDCKILVKFACSLKSLNSLHIIILNGLYNWYVYFLCWRIMY